MTSETTLERPEGISDVRWATIQNTVSLMATGHLPWCEEHIEDTDNAGWCKTTIKSFACEVELHNGTLDGAVKIALYLNDGVDVEGLTIAQTLAITGTLEQAARTAQLAASAEVGQ